MKVDSSYLGRGKELGRILFMVEVKQQKLQEGLIGEINLLFL